MTLSEIIEQLESCGFTCEAGPLENNVAWRQLRGMNKNTISVVLFDSDNWETLYVLEMVSVPRVGEEITLNDECYEVTYVTWHINASDPADNEVQLGLKKLP